MISRPAVDAAHPEQLWAEFNRLRSAVNRAVYRRFPSVRGNVERTFRALIRFENAEGRQRLWEATFGLPPVLAQPSVIDETYKLMRDGQVAAAHAAHAEVLDGVELLNAITETVLEELEKLSALLSMAVPPSNTKNLTNVRECPDGGESRDPLVSTPAAPQGPPQPLVHMTLEALVG